MAPYHQGQNVRGGFYLNRSKWEFEHVAGRDGVLPGEDEMLYSRVPLLFIVIVGPLIGLAYVLFLPLAFCAGVGILIAHQVGRRIRTMGSSFPTTRPTDRHK